MKYTNNLVKKMSKKQDTYQIMRYTPPFAKEIVPKLTKYDEIVAIPLYPHYSQTTTKSSVEDLMNEAKKYNLESKIKVVEPYFDNEKYNKLIIKKIKESLKDDKPEEFELIFSAHGLPKKIIEKGDAYQSHIEKNVESLKDMLKKENINFKDVHLAYQSRLGPMEWIRPYLDDKLEEVGKRVMIYPIAFAIDNSETEFELDIQYRNVAKNLGIDDYRVVKCLNDDDEFVEFLQSLV